MRPTPSPTALILALAATPCVAAAVTGTPQVQTRDPQASSPSEKGAAQLKGIVVQAVPGGARINDLVVPVAVLGGKELDADMASTLGETVSRIPGVQTTALGQAVGRPVIHGMGGPRVAVTEGGMSAADVSTISQDHAVTIEPFLANQIEVLKGPSTLLYGSGAIGGVVNAVTGRIPQTAPYDGFSGRVQWRYDSVSNGRTGMFRVDGGNEHFALHADGVRRDDHDYDIPGGTLANSWLRTTTGAVGGSLLGDWGFLGASVSRYMDTYGSPVEPGDPATGEPGVHIKMDQTRYDLKGGFHHPLPGIREIKISAARSEYQHVEYEGDEAGTRFVNQSNQARLLLSHEPIGGWKGSFGAQYLDRDFSAVGDETFVPPTATRDLGVFIVEQHRWGRLKLKLGARVDHHTSTPLNGSKRSFDPKTWSVGLGWKMTDAWRWTLNLDRSQRAPAEEELFAYGPHAASATFEIGNADLGVETAKQVELGLHYRSESVDAKISVYDNHFNDFIYLADTGNVRDGLPVRVWSQRDAHFRGVDAEATFHLVKGPDGHWDLRVFGDRVRATLDGAGNVPRIPASRLGGKLMWSNDTVSASLGALKYFDQNDIATHGTPTAGFTLVNAHLDWTFHQGQGSRWQAFIEGRNLTNQTARLATSLFKEHSPLPGRNIAVGLRAWF
ncbi:MAG TPA: TonB-dependent receptor [Oleiagrimonas sp.]|nr:TonB-dependent receptor [Oleiagrimonas sp.]